MRNRTVHWPVNGGGGWFVAEMWLFMAGTDWFPLQFAGFRYLDTPPQSFGFPCSAKVKTVRKERVTPLFQRGFSSAHAFHFSRETIK